MSNILASKAVLSSVSISAWTARRFDKTVTNEVHAKHAAAADAGRYTKQLVSKQSLADIVSTVSQARQFHYERTQPWLDAGARVLPSALYLEYVATMATHRTAFTAAVNAFCDGYPQFVEDAKARLNGLFRVEDYPLPSRIRRCFDFDVAILPLPDTSDFRIALTEENVEEVRRDVEERMQRVLNNSMRDSAERIVEAVGHMAERLKAYKPAKRRGDKAENAFRDSLVDNVRDLIALLPAFNMTGDPRMTAIIDRMAGLVAVDAETLRTSDNVRESVASAADAILRDVSEFLA